MRQVRMYTEQDLRVGSAVTLKDNAKYHLDKVLRLKKGSAVSLFNGDGCDYHGEVIQLDRHNALIDIRECQQVQNECDLDITLYCALLKGDTMDRVVQKSVELGVRKLVPMFSKHSEVMIKGKRLSSKMAHWQGVIQASTQQCGRAKMMQLSVPIAFAEAIEHAHSQRLIFSPHHCDTHALTHNGEVNQLGLLIGPEGGFHASEVDAAVALGWQCKSLGARILRADTAAISAVLMAQFHFSQEFANG